MLSSLPLSVTPSKRISPDFFNRSTLKVARNLLGQYLEFNGKLGRIVETEAYIGEDDPACHAARGITPRTKVMYGPAGYSYVYFIYGMYYCLNIVTEKEGVPGAVLIRALHVVGESFHKTNGPGKLCRYLGITTAHNNINLLTSENFKLLKGKSVLNIQVTPRIGIKVGTDKLWRFVIDLL